MSESALCKILVMSLMIPTCSKLLAAREALSSVLTPSLNLQMHGFQPKPCSEAVDGASTFFVRVVLPPARSVIVLTHVHFALIIIVFLHRCTFVIAFISRSLDTLWTRRIRGSTRRRKSWRRSSNASRRSGHAAWRTRWSTQPWWRKPSRRSSSAIRWTCTWRSKTRRCKAWWRQSLRRSVRVLLCFGLASLERRVVLACELGERL